MNEKMIQVKADCRACSHVLPSMQEEAADKMDELLEPIDVSDDFKKINEPYQSYHG